MYEYSSTKSEVFAIEVIVIDSSIISAMSRIKMINNPNVSDEMVINSASKFKSHREIIFIENLIRIVETNYGCDLYLKNVENSIKCFSTYDSVIEGLGTSKEEFK